MAKNERIVVGLDIGTSKICCVIAELQDDGAVHAIGLGEAPSRGLRKGVVVNLDATVEAIKLAVEQAEAMAELSVDRATIGLAGAHVRSFNSRGVVAVTGKDGLVSEEDRKRVMDAAQAVSIPQDREIVHALPQEFVLDNQSSIVSPVGMIGSRLEANAHIVTAASTSIQNLVSCANRAGIEVRDIVLGLLAVSESVLTPDERDLGVAVIDIGGGTTDLGIFEKGAIWHTAVLPVGGDHFTNDLAVGLRTPIPDAERLKTRYGCALASMVKPDDVIEVPSVGGRKPRLLSHQVMAEILQPRAEEIFGLIREEIVRAGFERLLNAGVVITGGGSHLPGAVEIAEQVFDLPVRQGLPGGARGLNGTVDGPQNASAIGLALWSASHSAVGRGQRESTTTGPIGKFGEKVRDWLSEMF